ncbi:MAG: cytochrome C [Deltaproteobacteria bacterium]|nr:cytochrome C [Deltaproteobacteria bacterium]
MKVKKRLNEVNGLVCLAFLIFVCATAWAQNPKPSGYVGSDACQDCHETEYENFKTYAKKAHSYESIKVMKKGLTEAEFRKCFECHTTGYKKPGGFRSEQETPNLKNAGCEVCHGPGSLHVETGEPEDIIGSMTAKDCEVCHSAERVGAFHYKPLIHGGAH